jgi:sugar/nucleoside kinase (ribokinase family)
MFPDTQRDIALFYKILQTSDVVKTSAQIYRSLKMSSREKALQKIYSYGPCLVVTTIGAAGCLAYDGHKIWRLAGLPAQAVDTAGAGDAFMGGLSYGRLQQWPTGQVLKFANACGTYKCQHAGTRSSGTLKEIEKYYKNYYKK